MEVLYLQVDGGSENANKYLLALLELLVSKRMIREIHYTRLPTGHTHEDIDGTFGNLWSVMKTRPVETIEDFRNIVENTFKYGKLKAKVKFIYGIPDYQKYFEDCIDKDFGRAYKLDHTQHCWLFEAVIPSSAFQFGTKTLHRAYTNDKVIEIEIKPRSECHTYYGLILGLEPKTVLVKRYPDEATIETRPGIEGFHLLVKLPPANDWTGFTPIDFNSDGIKQFHTTYSKICRFYHNGQAERRCWDEWWEKIAPHGTTDDYYRTRRLHQPLKSFFKSEPIDLGQHWRTQLNLFPHRNNLHSIDEFIWPTETSVALPCVKTSWTKNPGPSRSLSSTDSFVRAKVVAFKSRTSSYYTLLAQYQQKYLIENVIRPRMNWSGDLLCSPSTTKSDMLKFILNDDINFMRLRYRIRVPAIETYLGTILFGNSIPDLQVQATLRNDRRTLSQQQLKDFIPSTALSDTTIDFCIHLHRINENKIQSVFNLTEKPKECFSIHHF
jgi:hypothetical protein